MTTKNTKLVQQFILAMLSLLVIGWEGEIRVPKDIVEGAKKEAQLVFYAGIPIPDAQTILLALEKKYPFIKTTF
jgi:hypothetical protein